VKAKKPAGSRKKVVVVSPDRTATHGYLAPAALGRATHLDILTPEGEMRAIPMGEVRCVYFVRDFAENFEPERKTFYSRPKLDGLWVRLTFHDHDAIEGIIPNDLLDLLENGVQITPPDLHGNSLRIFIPRSALAEMKVLGVVGVARRTPARPAPIPQPRLFEE
jgi:hypothetical protein